MLSIQHATRKSDAPVMVCPSPLLRICLARFSAEDPMATLTQADVGRMPGGRQRWRRNVALDVWWLLAYVPGPECTACLTGCEIKLGPGWLGSWNAMVYSHFPRAMVP